MRLTFSALPKPKTLAKTLVPMMALAATSLGPMTATPAMAKPPLRNVAEIDDNMLWVALAIEISDRCDSIAPRTLKGLAFLSDLQGRAKSLGYSSDEIKAYVKSGEEKARIRARGESYVRAKGLDPKNNQDLCTLGRDEMSKSSQIGVLLR